MRSLERSHVERANPEFSQLQARVVVQRRLVMMPLMLLALVLRMLLFGDLDIPSIHRRDWRLSVDGGIYAQTQQGAKAQCPHHL
jgi:hypothetical protein